jgi:hypothetical protein
MTSIGAISTTRIFIAPVKKGRALPANRVYRLKKEFMAICFETDGKGRIVPLPTGAVVEIVGFSCLSACFEVVWKGRRCSVFEVDLLGPWSSPTAASGRAAEGACA